jgi:hypothetical protein
MSLFLAAAAGFLSGKAEQVKAKREEERQIREEERLFDRQRKMYELQLDYESRTNEKKRLDDMAQKVAILVGRTGLPAEVATNVVLSGVFDSVFDAALKGELDYDGTIKIFGDSPVEGADATAVPRTDQGIFRRPQDELDFGGAPRDYGAIINQINATLANVLPSDIIESRTDEITGQTSLIIKNSQLKPYVEMVRQAASKAYGDMVAQNQDSRIAFRKVLDFLSQTAAYTSQNQLNYTDPGTWEAFFIEPLNNLSLTIPAAPPPPPAARQISPPVGAGANVPTAGVVPVDESLIYRGPGTGRMGGSILPQEEEDEPRRGELPWNTGVTFR